MKVSKYLWTVVVLIVCLSSSHAEEPSVDIHIPDSNYVQKITTYSGMTLIGRIEDIDSASVDFDTDMGNLIVPIVDVKSIEEFPAEALKKGQYWFRNPNATRLFLMPTGRMPKKGKFCLTDYYIFLPSIAYSVTNWLELGAGVSLIPFIGFQYQVYYIMPRIGIVQREKFACAANIILVKFPIPERSGAGVLFAAGTFGSDDHSTSAGIGYGVVLDPYHAYFERDYESNIVGMKYPILTLGGQTRVARRISLVTENWIIPDIILNPPILVSFGVRMFGEKISVGLGFFTPLFLLSEEQTLYPFVPYADFVCNF